MVFHLMEMKPSQAASGVPAAAEGQSACTSPGANLDVAPEDVQLRQVSAV